MIRRLSVATLIGLLAPLSAQAQKVTAVDPAKSELRFLFKQMNVPVEGRFTKFTVQMEFDAAKPAASKAQIEIDLNSIDAGSADADAESKGKAWFNLALFPTAKFTSTSLKPLGGNRYEVVGKLTIKGRSRDMAAQFTTRQEGGNTVFEGAFPLKRLEYGIGEGPWADTETVADEVQVRFKFIGVAAKRP
jgi:polyisoprenoid-binding protein YceI